MSPTELLMASPVASHSSSEGSLFSKVIAVRWLKSRQTATITFMCLYAFGSCLFGLYVLNYIEQCEINAC